MSNVNYIRGMLYDIQRLLDRYESPIANSDLRRIMRERVQTSTRHLWVDGPDGQNYHCVICGISKVQDYAIATCETYLIERVWQFLSDGQSLAYLRSEWLSYLQKKGPSWVIVKTGESSMNHDQLVEAALAAIRAVFSDRSVSQSETNAALVELRDEIDVLIDSLESEDGR